MKRSIGKSFIAVLAALTMTAALSIVSLCDTVTIKEDGTNIRSSASSSSTKVTQASANQEYTVIETTTDSDGKTWYKIKVSDSANGYVRSDLVTLKQDGTTESSDANTASSVEPTSATAINEITATVAGNSPVNVRSGAGTKYEKTGTVDAGSTITLTAKATDSDGNVWYQFKTDSVEGFIREDLITLSETPTEVTEDAGADVPAEGENPDGTTNPDEYVEGSLDDDIDASSENNDYEIVYTTDDTGEYQYYLYNHIDNTRQKVEDLLGAISTLNSNYQKVSDSLTLFRILAIVFGALMVVFLATTIVFFIKSRGDDDDYYEDDEEDDEEEEEVEEVRRRPESRRETRDNTRASSRRRVEEEDDEEEEEEEAPRRRRTESNERPAARTQSRNTSNERGSERSNERSNRVSATRESQRRSSDDEDAIERPKRQRRAQNFLADDDEFEFEFLNMDDKE